jgi:hypothetical protein
LQKKQAFLKNPVNCPDSFGTIKGRKKSNGDIPAFPGYELFWGSLKYFLKRNRKIFSEIFEYP